MGLSSSSVKSGGACSPWRPTSARVGLGTHLGKAFWEKSSQLEREERRFLQNQTEVTFLLTKRIFMQKAFQMSLKQRAEMNLKCLTYAFSALSSNYDNLGGYVNYTILVK